MELVSPPLIADDTEEASCKHCQAVWRFRAHEVMYIDASQSEDFWIVCRHCKNNISLSKKNELFKQLVRDKNR